MYHVYRVSGNKTNRVYYGYHVGEPDIQKLTVKFVSTASVPTRISNAHHFLAENDGDRDIKLVVLESFVEEVDAFLLRNHLRAEDVMSVGSPSWLPHEMHERALRRDPQRTRNIITVNDVINKRRECKTARQAWVAGMFTKDQILTTACVYGKSQVMNDLDKMNPFDFAHKYQLK